ncbi:MAG: DUF3367 domain-containing protein [Chloroflexi bacterium]|nr:DUF3367 domain-containing protein [Chloroflexota bacterium]
MAPDKLPIARWLLIRSTKVSGSKLFPVIIFTGVSIGVLWSLLLPGYILTLDMVFPLDVNQADWFYGLDVQFNGALPVYSILFGLSLFLPMWLVQKLILIGIFVSAGLSAYHLCPSNSRTGKYFAGLLYTLNPFVYVRFMAGQWLLLLAYAVLPLAVKAFIDFLENPGGKNGLRLALLITLVSTFNPHLLIILFVVILMLQISWLISERGQLRLRGFIKGIGIAGFSFILLNIYWIIPVFTEAKVLARLGTISDLPVFTAKSLPGVFNVLFSVATMHGFWRPGYNYISSFLPFWQLIFVAILFVAIYGFVNYCDHAKTGWVIRGLAGVAIIAILLGTGISTPFFSDLYSFLFENVVLFRGFRDSHKFVALLALAYMYLGGVGVDEIKSRLSVFASAHPRRTTQVLAKLPTVLLLLPVLFGLNMWGGFNGELSLVNYPNEWYEVKHYLDEKKGDFKVLFLPWHEYMDFAWSGRRIANPAAGFFARPMIQGENIQVGGIETQSIEPVQYYIQFIIDTSSNNGNNMGQVGAMLAPLNVKYILLAKEADYKAYNFLYRQSDLQVVFENRLIVVFENLYPTARFYEVNMTKPLSAWTDLLQEIGHGADSTGAVFTLETRGVVSPPSLGGEGLLEISYQQLSPVSYVLHIPRPGFVIFSDPYDGDWAIDAVRPLANLGLTNAFAMSTAGTYTLSNDRYLPSLVGYLISALTLSIILVYLTMTKFRDGWAGQPKRQPQ